MTTPRYIEGFLAYFDIQGFSEKLKTSDFSHDFDSYCDILNKGTTRLERGLEYRFFQMAL